jgi:carnitine O-acetyltransferase
MIFFQQVLLNHKKTMKRILVKRVPSNGPSRFYSSKRPTFENQEKLPRLPIPKLEDTLKTYEKSLEPFLTPEELQGHSSVLKSFESGLGPVLQKRLIQYGKTAKNSWLEQFWLENAYLKYREPSMINSNWWCEFVDSPEQPRDHLIKPPPPGVISSFQVKRAAGLISNFLNFNDMLNDQTFPPETIKGMYLPL